MSRNFNDTKWYSYTSSTETKRTWAKCIKSYEEIPKEFLPAFPEYKDQFPNTVFIPEDRFSLFHKRNKKIICVYEDHFVLLENLRNEFKTFAIKFSDVLYLERGRILLKSWLKIITLSGIHFIRFNTTNDYLFVPVIEKIRQGMCGSPTNDAVFGEDKEDTQELSEFDYLKTVNFKYMNYGRKSIRPDDIVIGIVYQPGRCIQEINFLNKTLFRRNTTDHLTILTEEELILIKEGNRIKTDKEINYGGVITYIPRCQIHDISFISNPENSHIIMEISLPENNRLSSEFSFTNEELKQMRNILE
jgi:hypothetical protein